MEEDRYIQITLRIPKELHAQLRKEASASSKSLNAEIIGRLRSSIGGPTDESDAPFMFTLLAFLTSLNAGMALVDALPPALKEKDRNAALLQTAADLFIKTGEPAPSVHELTKFSDRFEQFLMEERARAAATER